MAGTIGDGKMTRAIIYETATHYVVRHAKGWFEIYRNGHTAAVKCATIGKGPGPNLGVARAIAECDKRSLA